MNLGRLMLCAAMGGKRVSWQAVPKQVLDPPRRGGGHANLGAKGVSGDEGLQRGRGQARHERREGFQREFLQLLAVIQGPWVRLLQRQCSRTQSEFRKLKNPTLPTMHLAITTSERKPAVPETKPISLLGLFMTLRLDRVTCSTPGPFS